MRLKSHLNLPFQFMRKDSTDALTPLVSLNMKRTPKDAEIYEVILSILYRNSPTKEVFYLYSRYYWQMDTTSNTEEKYLMNTEEVKPDADA